MFRRRHHVQRWCRSTFAGNINSALLPSDVIDFAMLPAQRFLAGLTVSLLDVVWPLSNQWERALLGKKFQLYNNHQYVAFFGRFNSRRYLILIVMEISLLGIYGAYCTLRICTLRIEKSVLCELRNLYFANWEICTLRIEKSVLCELRNLYFANWEICTLRIENLYFANWEICTLRIEKSVLLPSCSLTYRYNCDKELAVAGRFKRRDVTLTLTGYNNRYNSQNCYCWCIKCNQFTLRWHFFSITTSTHSTPVENNDQLSNKYMIPYAFVFQNKFNQNIPQQANG